MKMFKYFFFNLDNLQQFKKSPDPALKNNCRVTKDRQWGFWSQNKLNNRIYLFLQLFTVSMHLFSFFFLLMFPPGSGSAFRGKIKRIYADQDPQSWWQYYIQLTSQIPICMQVPDCSYKVLVLGSGLCD